MLYIVTHYISIIYSNSDGTHPTKTVKCEKSARLQKIDDWEDNNG